MMLAICFYGMPSREVKQVILNKCKELDFKLFESYNVDATKSLQDVSFKKRDYEIENNIEFKACLALNTTDIEMIKNFNVLRLGFLRYNVLYFIKGYFNSVRYKTGVNPEMFYANSITFDRICEYHTNLNHIDRHWIRSNKSEEIFYYHIKSLLIKAECVNHENSNLFIRTA